MFNTHVRRDVYVLLQLRFHTCATPEVVWAVVEVLKNLRSHVLALYSVAVWRAVRGRGRGPRDCGWVVCLGSWGQPFGRS